MKTHAHVSWSSAYAARCVMRQICYRFCFLSTLASEAVFGSSTQVFTGLIAPQLHAGEDYRRPSMVVLVSIAAMPRKHDGISRTERLNSQQMTGAAAMVQRRKSQRLTGGG